MAHGAARQQLLEGAIEHVSRHGIADLSLRHLAAALGTSHRMLSHHFGSKEGLWVAIVREVERRQQAVLADVAPLADATYETAMWAWWRHISDPVLWPNAALFFEVYGQALHGRPPANELLDGIVDTWVEGAAAMAIARGLSPMDAPTYARLGVAVVRGLLLDLLATKDREGVDAAFGHWVRLTAPAFERSC
jgi:AcrR family transcriptional regulator